MFLNLFAAIEFVVRLTGIDERPQLSRDYSKFRPKKLSREPLGKILFKKQTMILFFSLASFTLPLNVLNSMKFIRYTITKLKAEASYIK